MSILEPEVQPLGEEELVNKLGDVMNAHRFMQWLNKSGVLDQVRRRSNVYTIIIPIDEAIERLPENVVELLDTTPSDLKNLLEYHVIPKDVNIKQLKDGEILSSLNDKPILFNIYNRGLQTLSGSPIIKDIYQSNMHLVSVDRVLYPPQGDLYSIVSTSPLLQTIARIIENANLVREFSSPGAITLLAPSDEAFQQLNPSVIQQILQNPSRGRGES
jgi:transforming growth factor-beta-induced protein ig-h3